MKQSAALRGSKYRDRVRRAHRAEIGAFKRIDRNINLRQVDAIRRLGADFLADIQHRSFVAFTFSDDDAAAHGHRVHSAAHGFGRDLVGVLALSHAHRLCRGDSRLFDNSHQLQGKFKLELLYHVMGLEAHLLA